jgi:hypothetical protein
VGDVGSVGTAEDVAIDSRPCVVLVRSCGSGLELLFPMLTSVQASYTEMIQRNNGKDTLLNSSSVNLRTFSLFVQILTRSSRRSEEPYQAEGVVVDRPRADDSSKLVDGLHCIQFHRSVNCFMMHCRIITI